MAKSQLYELRVNVLQFVEVVEKSEEKKERWRKAVPRMLPSELAELMEILLKQTKLDAELETIGEVKKGKFFPENDEELEEHINAKVVRVIAEVKERTERALSE